MESVMVPHVEVEITNEEYVPPVGNAGVVLVLGNFEKAQEGKKYYIRTPRQAKNLLGEGYTGNKFVQTLFTRFEDPNGTNEYVSKGVTKVIAYQLGTRTGAKVTLKDGETSPKDTLELELVGGLYGKDKQIEIVPGKISGQTVNILDETGNVIKSYVDVKDKAELIKRIMRDSNSLIAKVKDLEPDVTSLGSVPTPVKFTGGTENNTVTNQVLIDALEVFEESEADFLGISEPLTLTGYEIICDWADSKLTTNTPLLPVLQVPKDMNYAQKKQLGLDTLTFNRWLIDGVYNSTEGNETSALIIALAAGMNISDSPDFPVIAPIDHVEPIYNKTDKADLTDAGITVFDIRSEEKNQYGLNLAVTGEQRIRDTGKKCEYRHVYVVRALHKCIKHLDLTAWLKDGKIIATQQTSDAELDRRVDELKEGNVVRVGKATAVPNYIEDPTEVIVMFNGKVGPIPLKIKLNMDISFFQGV